MARKLDSGGSIKPDENRDGTPREPHPLRKPEDRAEERGRTSQELKALEQRFEAFDKGESRFTPIEKVIGYIKTIAKTGSEEQRKFLFEELSRSLGAIYGAITDYRERLGRHILSYPSKGDLLSGVKQFVEEGKRQRYSEEAIEDIVRSLTETHMPRVYESLTVYQRLDRDRETLRQFRGLVSMPPGSIVELRKYMSSLVLESHEDFAQTIIGKLVEYRDSLHLVEDNDCDKDDIRSKVIRDIRRDDTQPSFLLGYTLKVFEFVSSDLRTQVDLTAGNLARGLVDLGTNLLKSYDSSCSSAEAQGIPVDKSTAEELRRRYKTVEGTAFQSKGQIEEFLNLEEQVLGQLDGILANAVRGTDLEAHLCYEEVRVTIPGAGSPSYHDLRERTRTLTGEAGAFQKDITRFVTTEDADERSKRAGEIQQVVGGTYAELQNLKGYQTIIECPDQLEILESINSILREPTQESINQLRFQITVLFEAHEMCRLYNNAEELVFGKKDASAEGSGTGADATAEPAEVDSAKAKAEKKGLVEEMKDRLGRRYVTVANLEGLMGNIDLKLSYPSRESISELIDVLAEKPEGRRTTLQEIDAQLARLYEVIQVYSTLADSRKRVDALREEFRLEGQLLDRGPDLSLQASLVGSHDLKMRTLKALVAQRRSLGLEEDEGCEDMEIFTKIIDGLKGRSTSLNNIVGYAVPIFKESITDFAEVANTTCEMWRSLIAFGKNLLESYEKISSVAEALGIEVDKSRSMELRALYAGREIGNALESRKKTADFVALEEQVLAQIRDMYPAVLDAVRSYKGEPETATKAILKRPPTKKKIPPKPAPASKEPEAAGKPAPVYGQAQETPVYTSENQTISGLDEAITAGERAQKTKAVYLSARKIIEEGEGGREENNRAIDLLKSVQDELNVHTELTIIGNLESAKWLAYKAGRAKEPEQRTKLYDEAKGLLRDALRLDPNFKGALIFLDDYTKKS